MITVESIIEWRRIRSTLTSKRIGLVPTMGYLHEGHLSLMKQARQECDIVVASIFVNPLQFGENEDYSTYPRDLKRDADVAEQAGVHYLFTPASEEMYPQPIQTRVTVGGVTEMMCGRTRPGHFDGVATVVMKLVHIIQPHRAYFGLKDAQQVAVVSQMVTDLNLPVQIRPCPTVREKDGLALSSRNIHLSAVERKQATILYQTLQWAQEQIERGERNVSYLEQQMTKYIHSSPLADIEYVQIRRFPDLQMVDALQGKMILALAVKFGETRLIDNMIVEVNDHAPAHDES